MDRDGQQRRDERPWRGVIDRDTVAGDAVVGGALALVLSFVPFSTVAGGVAAAHRRDGGYLAGLAVGALAGVVAAVPLALLFVPAVAVAGWLGYGVAPSSPAYDLFLAIVGALFVVYTVGLSALGGLVGTWTARHADRDLDPVAWL